jgi:hypothetical protein
MLREIAYNVTRRCSGLHIQQKKLSLVSEGAVDEDKCTKTTVVGKHSIPEKLLYSLQMKCLVEDLHNCVQVTKCFYFAHS